MLEMTQGVVQVIRVALTEKLSMVYESFTKPANEIAILGILYSIREDMREEKLGVVYQYNLSLIC